VLPEVDAVILDFSANAESNRRALAASELHAETQVDNIRIEFDAAGAEEVLYDERPAMRIRIPASVTRLQRRDSYRIKLPQNRAVYCRMPSEDGSGRETPIRIFDLSVGGFALIDVPPTLNLVPGSVVRGCRIDLPSTGTVPSDVEIVHIVESKLPNGRISRRCGCRFLNLLPATVTLIQRFINRVERDQLAHG
jgi:c-di-GMP-binding flagellar brake protein YcgR